MAARLHINHRVLSRLKYEKGAGLSDDTLLNIMEHMNGDADERARFLACYLRDRIVGPDDVRDRVRILVDEPARLQESAMSRQSEISTAARRLEYAALKNDRVRAAMMSLSDLASSS